MHKKKAGKLQTGNTFPKQYWLAVNGKPKNGDHCSKSVHLYNFHYMMVPHTQKGSCLKHAPGKFKVISKAEN